MRNQYVDSISISVLFEKLFFSLIFLSLTSCGFLFQNVSNPITGGGGSSSTITVSIDVTPSTLDFDLTPTFEFDATSTGGDITGFECRLDSGSYTSCTSPFTSAALAAGSHTLYVRATDSAGNVSNAETYSWTIGVTVEAVYPTNGANWMDYVKNNNGGTTVYDQPDAACAGTELGYNECIHGGEKRKVEVTGHASCTNLAITDSLGAFDWTCDDSSGTAIFYSSGLKSAAKLSSLLNATSWKDNSVTITLSGSALTNSEDEAWYTNPVVAAPANPLNTDIAIILDGNDDDGAGPDQVYTTGTIFTVASSTTSTGYNLNLDKIAFVVLDGETLTYSGNAAGSQHNANGEYAVGGHTPMLGVGTQKFLWIEGAFADGGGAANRYILRARHNGTISSFLVIRHVEGVNFNQNCISFHTTHSSKLESVTCSDSGSHGVNLELSTYNTLENIKGYNCTGSSVRIYNDSNYNTLNNSLAVGCSTSIDAASENKLYNIRVHRGALSIGISTTVAINNSIVDAFVSNNTGGNGIQLTGLTSNDNIFVRVESHNNSGWGFSTQSENTLLFGSFNSNGSVGFAFTEDSGTYANFVSSNNSTTGVSVGGNSNFLYNVVSARNGNRGFLVGDDLNMFRGFIGSGNNGTNCFLSGAGPDNEIDNNCDYGPGLALSATVSDVSGTFVGKVSDSTNTSNTAGVEDYDSITDWENFENFFRGWGQYHINSFPDSANLSGPCISTEDCQIWDWRLTTTDTEIRNINGTFTAGAACPASVDGNDADVVRTDSGGRTFLLNAFEIVDDDIGNNNGLCESNESCIFAPNIGRYQGHGDYASNGTCTFNDGTVSGVTMYAYPNNGI